MLHKRHLWIKQMDNYHIMHVDQHCNSNSDHFAHSQQSDTQLESCRVKKAELI